MWTRDETWRDCASTPKGLSLARCDDLSLRPNPLKKKVLTCGAFVATITSARFNANKKESRTMNMTTDVRARIDMRTKKRAAAALSEMGLSCSDAIRLFLVRVADERRLPFEVKAPNATTRAAMAELEAGRGKRFKSVDALMADLNADD